MITLGDCPGLTRQESPVTTGLGHAGATDGVAFSPDGKLLVTTSADRQVRLWDVATQQTIGTPLTGHGGWVYGAALSPDGSVLATTGASDGAWHRREHASTSPMRRPSGSHEPGTSPAGPEPRAWSAVAGRPHQAFW